MAKVVMPLGSIEARGRVAGLIYNTWRGLNTVKSFKSPVQPNTAAQLAARARLKTYAQAWAGLTSVQRAAWNQYATDHPLTDWTNKAKRATGQNWYVSCNTRIAITGQAAITDPPAAVGPAAPTGFALACAGGAGTPLSATWTTPAAAGSYCFIYLVGPQSLGRTPKVQQAALAATIASNTAHPYTLNATAPAGRYGAWLVIVDSTTGLASQMVYAEFDVS